MVFNSQLQPTDYYYQKEDHHSQQQNPLEHKIKAITKGFIDYYSHILREQSPQNIEVICDYLTAMQTEVNPVEGTKKNQIQILCNLSKKCKQIPFKKMTDKDVLAYLNHFKKTEEADPYHK